MSKKIIIFNGSPRAKGNTSTLIGSFVKGAEESGNRVKTFFLDGMDIQGCKGCFGGGKDPESPCAQKDDMDDIYPVYKDADIVVLASPLYFWNISGQLKCAIDRLFAVAECNDQYKSPAKDCILIMAAEGNGFEETIQYYNGLLSHLGWNDIGQILVSGVNNIGDIEGNPALDEAKKLGRSIA